MTLKSKRGDADSAVSVTVVSAGCSMHVYMCNDFPQLELRSAEPFSQAESPLFHSRDRASKFQKNITSLQAKLNTIRESFVLTSFTSVVCTIFYKAHRT